MVPANEGDRTILNEGSEDAVPGSYIIRLCDTPELRREGADAAAARLARRYGGTVKGAWNGTLLFAFAGDFGPTEIRRLLHDPDVAEIEANVRLSSPVFRPRPSE